MTEWTAIGFSSIYRVLAQLENDGHIEARLEHQGQGAPRKVYSITPRGREALREGVRNCLNDGSPVRSPFQIALAFLTEAPLSDVKESLDVRLARTRQVRGEVQEMAQHLANVGCNEDRESLDSRELSPRRWCAQRLLEYALGHLGAEEEFLASLINKLIDHDARPTDSGNVPSEGADTAQETPASPTEKAYPHD